jgi:hypothetical protein
MAAQCLHRSQLFVRRFSVGPPSQNAPRPLRGIGQDPHGAVGQGCTQSPWCAEGRPLAFDRKQHHDRSV